MDHLHRRVALSRKPFHALRRTTLAIIVAAAAALAAPAAASALNVYAATSLTDAFAALNKGPTYSFGGSNTLRTQIERGAPADVFASASPIYTQDLYRDGLIGKPRAFATNSLVLAVPRSNPAKIHSVFDLAKRPKLKLVVAGQKVPIGLYTREVLKRVALLRVLRKAVSQEPDAKGIVGKLALGEADAGFVYATDVRAASSRLIAVPLPKRSQPTVRYEVAVVQGSNNREAALEFVADLLSTDGRRELAKAGFGLP
jgi:molybdate transport system substrate-binding protein